jgi:heme-degrading monooxygenase HmoA
MISTLLTFQYEDSLDEEKITSIAESARSKFEGMPGLRSKAFTASLERNQAINFYVWETPDAAKAFFTPENIAMITGIYGTSPDICYLDIKVLVDNHKS